jgi:glycosyltransferase involved in cell wall biosynthesis
MNLIIYMPAYNECESIQQVINSLPCQLENIDNIQILVIDDGSTDLTAQVAKDCGAQVILHNRNRGVGAAFQTAVQFALDSDTDILVSIDADGQFNSAEIPGLIQPIIAHEANMVIGNRFASGKPNNMPKAKYWGNQQVAQLVRRICNQNFMDVSSGFRAYDREALLRLNIFGKFTYTHETILSLVYQDLCVKEIPVQVKYFPERKSRVAGSLLHYALQVSKIILRVLLDYRPMMVFGSMGGIFLLIGCLFELFLMGYYIFEHSFTPYKTAGFIGLGFVIFGMLVLLIALITDMLNRLKVNQDKLLYEIKKIKYSK